MFTNKQIFSQNDLRVCEKIFWILFKNSPIFFCLWKKYYEILYGNYENLRERERERESPTV